jgi:hypothetical protein
VSVFTSKNKSPSTVPIAGKVSPTSKIGDSSLTFTLPGAVYNLKRFEYNSSNEPNVIFSRVLVQITESGFIPNVMEKRSCPGSTPAGPVGPVCPSTQHSLGAENIVEFWDGCNMDDTHSALSDPQFFLLELPLYLSRYFLLSE